MFVDNIFTDDLGYPNRINREKEGEQYSPWNVEIHNFKKTPQLSFSRRKTSSRCRYKSQLESYVNKSKEYKRNISKRKNILQEKSITIEY